MKPDICRADSTRIRISLGRSDEYLGFVLIAWLCTRMWENISSSTWRVRAFIRLRFDSSRTIPNWENWYHLALATTRIPGQIASRSTLRHIISSQTWFRPLRRFCAWWLWTRSYLRLTSINWHFFALLECENVSMIETCMQPISVERTRHERQGFTVKSQDPAPFQMSMPYGFQNDWSVLICNAFRISSWNQDFGSI
jgi:hypothetical protein